MAAAPARDCRAVRFHRDRGGMDGHRSRATTLGGARRDSDGRRRHADARSRRPDDGLRAPLPWPRGDRRHAHSLPRAGDDMSLLASIGLPEIMAGIMLLALNAYVLTGGADFGGGVWDLLARGPSRDERR